MIICVPPYGIQMNSQLRVYPFCRVPCASVTANAILLYTICFGLNRAFCKKPCRKGNKICSLIFYIGFNNPFTKFSQTARILNISKGRTFNARPGRRCGAQQKPPYTVLSLSIKTTCKGVIFRHESVVLFNAKTGRFIYL